MSVAYFEKNLMSYNVSQNYLDGVLSLWPK